MAVGGMDALDLIFREVTDTSRVSCFFDST